MDIRNSVHLLTSSIFAIIALLFLLLGFTLCNPEPTTTTSPSIDGPIAAAPAPALPGKKVWNANGCGACHNKNMTTDATGPALAGVTERWSDDPREDLYAWIRNNGKLRASGHPRALEVFNEWNAAAMNIYPDLTDEELTDLIAYIER